MTNKQRDEILKKCKEETKEKIEQQENELRKLRDEATWADAENSNLIESKDELKTEIKWRDDLINSLEDTKIRLNPEVDRLKGISNVYGPAMKALDGVAVVNLAEPSEGDLERVVKAYRECRRERDELKVELDHWRNDSVEKERDDLKKEISSLKESISAHDKSRAKVLLKNARLQERYNGLLIKVMQVIQDLLSHKAASYFSNYEREKFQEFIKEVNQVLLADE